MFHSCYIHLALKNWAKEQKSSVSALVLHQLDQQIQLRAFEKSLRKIPVTDILQETVNSLYAGRDGQ